MKTAAGHPAWAANQRRVRAFCIASALGLALQGLLAWMLKIPEFGAWGIGLVPMAPTTALGFLMGASAAAVRLVRPAGEGSLPMKVLALGTCLLGAGESVRFMLGFDAASEGFPLWRMSPLTGLLFILTGFSLLSLEASSRHPRVAGAGSAAALAVASVGYVVAAGYAHGVPLLYGGSIIPMALPTGLSFLFLGTAVLMLAGEESWLQGVLLGPSASAHVARLFIPFILVLLVFTGITHRFLDRVPELQRGVLHGVIVFLTLAVGIGVVLAAARRVGTSLAREEEVRRRLEEEMRRTRDLETLSQLFQGLAHEVRNPLFALDVNLALLEKVCREGGDASVPVAQAREQVRRIEGLVGELMNLAAPPDENAFQVCAAGDLLASALLAAQPEVENAGARVELGSVDHSLKVPVLQDRIGWTLVHLIQNAIQNAPPGVTVTLSARGEGESCLIEVRDTGPGLPEKLAPRLFTPFTTSHRGRRGLGLALARRYAEMHGGSLQAANNDPPPGASFLLRLPLSR